MVEVLDYEVVIVREVRRETRGLEKADGLSSEGGCHCGSYPQPKQLVGGRRVWKTINIYQHNFVKDILLTTVDTCSTQRRLSMLLLLLPYDSIYVMVAIP